MRFPFKGGRALRTRLARPEPFAQPPVRRRMLTCDRGADRAVSTHAANADGCCCRATFQRHCAVAGAASAGWRARAVRRRIALCSGVRGVQAPATWHCQSCALLPSSSSMPSKSAMKFARGKWGFGVGADLGVVSGQRPRIQCVGARFRRVRTKITCCHCMRQSVPTANHPPSTHPPTHPPRG